MNCSPKKIVHSSNKEIIKMAAKRPTGERPKQLSTLAKTVKSAARGGVASKSGKVEVLTPSQAAARAGKMRDRAAQNRKGAMTPTERAKLKKELKPLNEGSRSKSGKSALSAVAKRFGVTAREARDIATAVSTAAKVTARTGAGKTTWARPSQIAEVAKQVKEVGVAAATGKKGTSAGQTKKQFGETYYNKGKKRK
jgi:hypothetical protein